MCVFEHLDDGFLSRLTFNLVSILAIICLCGSHYPVQSIVVVVAIFLIDHCDNFNKDLNILWVGRFDGIL